MSRSFTLLRLITSEVKVRQHTRQLSRQSLCTLANGQIRDATVEDFDALISMDSDGYSGRDLQPFIRHTLTRGPTVHTFTHDPKVHTYVYEVNKQVVAFETSYVVDGGFTIVTRGTSVKDGYKNHDILKQFRDYVVNDLARKYSCKIVALTTTNTSGLASDAPFLQNNREILRRNVHIIPYVTSELDVPDRDDFSVTKLFQVTNSQLGEIMQKPTLTQYFFPLKRIIINSIPFRFMPDNMELIQAEDPFVLMSERLMSGPSPPSQGLVSMTTSFTHKDTTYVDMEFYGCSNNFPEICNHIRGHMARILPLAPRGQILVPHSYTINTDALLCAFSRYGLRPASSQLITQYLFEERIS